LLFTGWSTNNNHNTKTNPDINPNLNPKHSCMNRVHILNKQQQHMMVQNERN